MKYAHIERALCNPNNDDDTNVKESCKLMECGFEYVTGECSDGGKVFRKRK